MKRIYETLCVMLGERGYDVSNQQKFLQSFTSNAITNGHVNRQALHFITKRDNESLFVFFSSIQSMGIKEVEELQSRLDDQEIERCLLIYPLTLTPSAIKFINTSNNAHMKTGSIIETFAEDELTYNPIYHELSPRFTIMTKNESRRFLHETKFKPENLPVISRNDKVARYFGMKRGDIIRINRRSETAGIYIHYRICN